MQNKLFQSLSYEEKINFFIKCQELLIRFHPESEFIFRENNLATRKQFVEGFLKDYKGFCYQDDKMCILFNYIKIEDSKDAVAAIKSNLYQPPATDHNGISVDFVVFRELSDCLDFCRANYNPRLEYILFVKNNEPKIYKTENFLQHLE